MIINTARSFRPKQILIGGMPKGFIETSKGLLSDVFDGTL